MQKKMTMHILPNFLKIDCKSNKSQSEKGTYGFSS